MVSEMGGGERGDWARVRSLREKSGEGGPGRDSRKDSPQQSQSSNGN